MKWSQIVIDDFLAEQLKRLEISASEAKLELKLKIEPELKLLTVSTDASIFGRCLENVLNNAIRHSVACGVVEVGVSAEGEYVDVIVRDYGPGVDEAELERIFQPFYRTDAARNRHTGGLGLGLAITRSGMEALGGRVIAENAEPGLKVTLRLPKD